MKTSSLSEIKKELRTLDADAVMNICLRLGRYKKENKELMHYMLFEAPDERSYVENTKEEMAELFSGLPRGNVYLMKKSIRKIFRLAYRHIRYSAIPQTELEIRIFLCAQMVREKLPLTEGTVLFNLYRNELIKIASVLETLPEDLQADYLREITELGKIVRR